MARNGRTRKRSGVDLDIVLPAVMVQDAPVPLKLLFKIAPIHATCPLAGRTGKLLPQLRARPT